MKTLRKAFTIVEILTVVTIIAILIGVLLPAITKVKTMVKETKQKSQITTIGLAITGFKNDYGDYPPSNLVGPDVDYSGVQKLTEALVGWDLMGFHPDSQFLSDGEDDAGQPVYPVPLDLTDPQHVENLKKRKGPYLEDATEYVFRLGQVPAENKDGIFSDCGPRLEPDTYVICDVFTKRKLALDSGRSVRAGTPLLYYRANTNSKDHDTIGLYNQRIYDVYDNKYLMDLRPITEDGKPSDLTHPLADSSAQYEEFYEYIRDDKVPNPWPYRPDSYLLISAGADGQYGTVDDITNFK